LRYTTNLRGTLALVPISTHPTVQYITIIFKKCGNGSKYWTCAEKNANKMAVDFGCEAVDL
jgi:hypothetical protein